MTTWILAFVAAATLNLFPDMGPPPEWEELFDPAAHEQVVAGTVDE